MTTLIRDTAGERTEWKQIEPAPEVEDEPVRPTSRIVRIEIPDGFMATITLVPYTEPAD